MFTASWVLSPPLLRKKVEHRDEKYAGAACRVEHPPTENSRVASFKSNVECRFRKMPGRVIGTLIPLLGQVGIFHKLFVNGADDLHGDEAEVVRPKPERHLAGFSVVTSEEMCQGVEVHLICVALLIGKSRVEHRAVEFPLQTGKELSIEETLDLIDTRPIEYVEQGRGSVRVVIRFDELALIEETYEQGTTQQRVGARQIPAGSFEVACGVHKIFQQTTIHRFVWGKERGVILEKLAGLHGSDKPRDLERLGDVSEIGDQACEITLKEPSTFRLLRGHLYGAVNFDVVRSNKYEQRNESLVPSKTLAVTLLVRSEMCSFTKVDGGAAVHTQDATEIQFGPCLSEVVRIRNQLPLFLDLAIFREKPGAR